MPTKHEANPAPQAARTAPAEPRWQFNSRAMSTCRAISRVMAVGVAGVGTAVLVSWIRGFQLLELPDGVTMKANTSICFICAGLALLILQPEKHRWWLKWPGRLIAISILAAGALTLSEHIGGRDLGIDQIWFSEAPGAAATARPNRMGPPASTCFIFAGLTLLLMDLRSRKGQALWQLMPVAIGLIMMVPLIGYAYELPSLYMQPNLNGIALHTALAMTGLAIGLLCARPGAGFMAVVCADDLGGVMVRRLLLPAILAPILLGWLRTLAERHELLTAPMGRAALVLAMVLIFTSLVISTGGVVGRLSQQRKQAELAMAQALEAAKSAGRVKDQFLAVLSHELRTPLSPVVTLVHLLQQDDRLPAEAYESLSVISRNLELEVRLIDDLLDLTRASRGKLAIQKHTLDLHQLISHVASDFDAEVRDKGLRLDVSLQAGRTVVDADATRVQQVLFNLLRNSIKFTPSGGRITLASSNLDQQLVVRVVDTGMGIEPETIGRLFHPFEQADGKVTRQFGGLGLGLAVSRAIIRAHGGNITAASAGKNQGSTFTVTFPLTTSPLLPSKPSVIADRQSKPQFADMRVLLVEDHKDTALAMSRLLGLMGCQVNLADSISAAVGTAAHVPFDLLLCDLGLPDGSGLELMRQLRSRAVKPFKAIAISGFGMEEDLRATREAGFNDHLVKPVNLVELKAAMQRITQN
jgi:signal transduction histidine kinase